MFATPMEMFRTKFIFYLCLRNRLGTHSALCLYLSLQICNINSIITETVSPKLIITLKNDSLFSGIFKQHRNNDIAYLFRISYKYNSFPCFIKFGACSLPVLGGLLKCGELREVNTEHFLLVFNMPIINMTECDPGYHDSCLFLRPTFFRSPAKIRLFACMHHATLEPFHAI